MAETFGWLFVNSVPLLYDKRRVAKQYKVEMWLDLAQIVKELGIESLKENQQNTASAVNYIV